VTELPGDPTAEAHVLLSLLIEPPCVANFRESGSLDLLIGAKWQHRAAWQAMRQTPIADAGNFFLAWSRLLCEQECRGNRTLNGGPWHQPWTPYRCHAYSIWQGMEFLRDQAADAYTIDVRDDGSHWHCTLHEGHEISAHTFDYWLQLLRDAKEARDLIEIAHQMAMRAWDGDCEGAARLAGKIGVIQVTNNTTPESSVADILADA
jgi:hypothetical protein